VDQGEESKPRFTIRPLGKENRAAFSCGEQALDTYFKKQASQDIKRRVGAVFIVIDENNVIAGYYSLSSTAVLLKDLPADISNKLPKYPLVPSTLLGRLAVDERYRGYRLGEYMLIDALKRALEASQEIGSAAVIVDAKNQKAKTFYLKYGFIELPDQPFRLFLPMGTVAKLFKQ
jgi:predicted GNAT family N-acyltransferase